MISAAYLCNLLKLTVKLNVLTFGVYTANAVFFGALAGIAGLMLLGKTYTARAVMFINIEKIEFLNC